MNLTFVVAEFNPLTNGHEHLLAEAKKRFPDNKIVVIMSGNFVQRGEPAITHSCSRTDVAISLGADAVIELPVAFAISSAEDFAYGAVKIASSFAGENVLLFGSECGDLSLLQNAEIKLREMNNSPLLKKNLKSGKSFATSQIEAVGGVLLSPNNLLGVMYLKAIKDLNSSLKPHTILRTGEYNSNSLNSTFVSASALREYIKKGDFSALEGKMPQVMLEKLTRSTLPDTNKLFSMLKYKFLTTSADELNKIEGVTEGIEYRIMDKIESAHSFEELISLVSTKRYPASKVRRIVLKTLLGIQKDQKKDIKENLNYFRVLGVKEKIIYSLLSNSSFVMLSKKRDEKQLCEKQQSFLALDILADKIYDFITI